MKNALIIVLLVLSTCSMSARTNFVTREIFYENGSIKVKDSIGFPLEVSRHFLAIESIVVAAEKSSGQISNAAGKLYRGEDLRIENVSAKIEGDEFRMSALLRVILPGSGAASICLAPMYGASLPPDPPSPQDTEPMLQVFAGDEIKALWFPEWKQQESDPAQVVADLINRDYLAGQFLGRSDLRVRSSLKTEANEEVVLLDYMPETPPLNGPDADLLRRLHSAHPISGNDLRRLFTKTKVAKSGYYLLAAGNFTNKPPITFPGKSWVTASPLPQSASSKSGGTNIPNLSFQIDGKLDDWKSRTPAWEGISRSQERDLRVFWLDKMLYASDSNYLYLFLEFQPSVGTRYEALYSGNTSGSIGNIADIYLDIDSDVKTGYDGKESRTKGADLEIVISAGSSFQFRGNQVTGTPQVTYRAGIWDPVQKLFIPKTTAVSTSDPSLISHGPDGVEIALNLSDVRARGNYAMKGTVQFGRLGVESRIISIQIK